MNYGSHYCGGFQVTTDTHFSSLCFPSLVSILILPYLQLNASANLGGFTGYHALLRPGLLCLFVYFQNWSKEYQEISMKRSVCH